MKISVIVPTYKPNDYLWECLESLSRQTIDKSLYEVIIVLNGCKDPYHSLILKWKISHSYMNLVYVQTDMGGVSNARNIALDLALGEYITFIDDDDYVSPYFLEDMYNVASESTVVVCNPKAFVEGQNRKIKYPIESIYNKLYQSDSVCLLNARKFFSGPCMKLIPKEVIGKNRYDVRFKNGEDSIFMFQISNNVKRVAFSSPRAIYYRRFRSGSAMTQQRSRWQIIVNNIKMMSVYCGIYLKNPFGYNFLFFVTRILGAIHSIMAGVKKI